MALAPAIPRHFSSPRQTLLFTALDYNTACYTSHWVNKIGHEQARVFKNKPFARFARRNEISDSDLCTTVRNANRGLIDADLGGGIIKQRVARRGSGNSGGFRTIIVFKAGVLAIFVHGFAKNEMENIGPDELRAMKKLASEMLNYQAQDFAKAVASGTLTELKCNDENEAIKNKAIS